MKKISRVTSFEDVISVANATQEQLHERALSWFYKTYNSENDMVHEYGKNLLIASGHFDIDFHMNEISINHTVNIEFREGRYKYSIDNFVGRICASAMSNGTNDLSELNYIYELPIGDWHEGWSNKKKQEKDAQLMAKIDPKVIRIVDSLESAMSC